MGFHWFAISLLLHPPQCPRSLRNSRLILRLQGNSDCPEVALKWQRIKDEWYSECIIVGFDGNAPNSPLLLYVNVKPSITSLFSRQLMEHSPDCDFLHSPEMIFNFNPVDWCGGTENREREGSQICCGFINYWPNDLLCGIKGTFQNQGVLPKLNRIGSSLNLQSGITKQQILKRIHPQTHRSASEINKYNKNIWEHSLWRMRRWITHRAVS